MQMPSLILWCTRCSVGWSAGMHAVQADSGKLTHRHRHAVQPPHMYVTAVIILVIEIMLLLPAHLHQTLALHIASMQICQQLNQNTRVASRGCRPQPAGGGGANTICPGLRLAHLHHCLVTTCSYCQSIQLVTSLRQADGKLPVVTALFSSLIASLSPSHSATISTDACAC